MEQHRRALQVGIFSILCSVMIRLFSAGLPGQLAALLSSQSIRVPAIFSQRTEAPRSDKSISAKRELFWERNQKGNPVGSLFRSISSLRDAFRDFLGSLSVPSRSRSPKPTVPTEEASSPSGYPFHFLPESAPPLFPDTPEPENTRPVFTEADLEEIKITNFTGENPDLKKLLLTPWEPELRGNSPTVLILHTHATESYTQSGEDYVQTAPYRTLDERYNMLSLGDRVTRGLEEAGIRVIHDRTLHDYPSYNDAYLHARNGIRELLEEYPGIQLVLDLHRDAAGDDRHQLRTHARIREQESAQLMLVLGMGSETRDNNLCAALHLQAQLNRQCPGLARPISLRTQRFNQDLAPTVLLVEIGAAGNTHPEAVLAAEELTKAIIAFAG